MDHERSTKTVLTPYLNITPHLHLLFSSPNQYTNSGPESWATQLTTHNQYTNSGPESRVMLLTTTLDHSATRALISHHASNVVLGM